MKPRFITWALATATSTALAGGPSAAGQPPGARSAPPAGQLFLLLYSPGPAWKAGRPAHEQDLRTHAVYHRDMVRRGRSFAAGGFTGVDGGMAIVRAVDVDEARAILAADPAVANGVFVGELRQWVPRYHGSGPLVEARR